MELVCESVLLGVVERPVAAPVVTSSIALYRAPLGLVLGGNLVPQLVVFRNSASGINLIPGGDVTKEFVGVLG